MVECKVVSMVVQLKETSRTMEIRTIVETGDTSTEVAVATEEEEATCSNLEVVTRGTIRATTNRQNTYN